MKNILVLIEWVDSAQPVSSWYHFIDAPELEVVECVSVGWVVGENDTVIMIAPNIGNFESGGEPQGSGFIRIPKVSITRKVKLNEAKNNI